MGTEEGSAIESVHHDSPERTGEAQRESHTGVQGGAATAAPPVRMLAGRYRLGARLGRGGMGTVWRALDEMLDREVAVKELSVGHLAEEDLQIVHSRMKQEARAAARIRHAGVITIHDVLEQDGKPWIVMELIDGRSLAELVEQDGTLNPREAADIGAQVMTALHRGHLAGVIHRDVKPANVLLERGTGRVVLTDFGIATYEGDSALTRTGDLIGSPDYLAPERVHGARPGPASDLWGLGATLFAAVEGESPFRRDSPLTTLTAVVTDPLPEPRNAGALTPVLQALLSKDPDERPDALTAIRMLQRVAAGDTTNIAVSPSPLRNPTAAVPLVDRNEHTPTPAVRTLPVRNESTRPALMESEYRQRTLAEPESDPDSATERGTVRRSHAPHGRARRRRVWPWLVVAALLAALAGGGLAYDYKILRHRSTPQPQTSQSAASSYTPVIPPGYTLTKDPEGFSFPLPDNPSEPWSRQPDSKATAINYSPDATEDYLICFAVTSAGTTPLQHAQSMAVGLANHDSSYRLVPGGAPEANVFHGYVGALWNFTYIKKAVPGVPSAEHEIIEQLYRDNYGTEYDILVDYPYADWQTGYQRFLDVTNGFSAP